MSIKFVLPGRTVQAVTAEPKASPFVQVEVIREKQIDSESRGDAAPTEELAVPEDAVVELTFADGTRRWTSAATLREDLLTTDPAATTARGTRVPAQFALATAERGAIGGLVLKALKVLKVDPVDAAAGLTAKAVVAHFESKALDGPGLMRFTAMDQPGVAVTGLDAGSPLLLFLHGFCSSTNGAFGALAGTAEWSKLRDSYGDRILGFDHPTLSRSPIENALEVARKLPRKARLHMVSHSRGGLVGELLSLDPAQKLNELKSVFPSSRQADVDLLRDLMAELAAKTFTVERFVRVACPARGTTLASQRLDLYLSALMNLLELIPAARASMSFEFVKAVTLEVARRRTDPRELPGVEAMMPDSPLIRMLNTVAKSGGDLAVIAGDAEGDGVLGKLKTLAIDAFFLAKNDYVVNTEAMYGGIPRGDDDTKPFRYTDPDIDHFSYFAKQSTRSRMANWILNGPTSAQSAGFDRGFVPRIILDQIDKLRTDTPLVFVLPGIMGSKIKVGKESIWINPLSLATGGLTRMGDLANSGGSDGILNSFYGMLSTALNRDFVVEEFGYDWRKSLEVAAKELAAKVEEKLAQRKTPIYFVAHSMGGLVVRMMMANHPDTWKKVLARRGRVLMLGTPNRGSYAVAYTLGGQDKLVRMLGLVDVDNSEEQLRQVIKGFPGLLELLPEELFDPAAWADKPGMVVPDSALLKGAKAARDKIKNVMGPDGIVYVAGAGATVNGWRVDNGKLWFTNDPLGDGTVTHASGLLPGVLTRYVNAQHGNLPNHVQAFEGYVDLLKNGTTNRLSDTPILSRGVEAARVAAPTSVLFPTEDELAAAALGGTPPTAQPEAQPPLRVGVVHGDLRFARMPVAVGHYEGDTIVSAESAIDRALGGELMSRFHMGMYPGPAGTAEVILGPTENSLGAIVIGLGAVGEITFDKVRDGVAMGALRYAMARVPTPSKTRVDLTFGSLLIGTFGGRNSLTVEQTVRAIVIGAAQANRTLKDQNLADRVRIAAIDIIEIYEDYALQAAEALDRLVERIPQEQPELSIEMAPRYIRAIEGGAFHRPADEYSSGWWRRVQVTKEQKEGVASCQLQFLALTDRARAEQRTQNMQAVLVDGLVKEAQASVDPKSTFGRTLFNLLIPDDFKLEAASEANMALVLDGGAAQYPWELLTVMRGGKPEPFAISKGLVRQFKTKEFRMRPRSTTSNSALVIGDPKNDLFQLDGARREAEDVAAVLQAECYNVTKLIQPDALAAVNAMFASDYRILHIAGHGQYDPKDTFNSGVLLSQGAKITAAEIESLQTVPELVFLNCCHTGAVDKENFHRLAASISEQLIRIGVRAVVAAGWAVSDDAAATFAKVFYGEMLAGRTFGEALQTARLRVYRDHPNSNTWGAYQCYGNPAFSLTDGKAKWQGKQRRCYSKRQQQDQLRNWAVEAKTMSPDRAEERKSALNELLNIMPEAWKDGETLALMANVWRELGDFDRAIPIYERAIAAEEATAPIRAEQDLANLLSRTQRNAEARRILARLLEIGETSERRALLGGVEKRSALAAKDPSARLQHLKKAEEAYRRAYEMAVGAGQPGVFPALNYAAMAYLTRSLKRAELQELIGRIRQSVKPVAGAEATAWDRVYLLDADFLTCLADATLEAKVTGIAEEYRNVFGLTAREKASIVGQFQFFEQIFHDTKKPKLAKCVSAILQAIA